MTEPTPAQSEVEQLADAYISLGNINPMTSAAEHLRGLARVAAAVGARIALEDFAKSLAANRPDLAGLANYVTTEVATAYTTDEETTA